MKTARHALATAALVAAGLLSNAAIAALPAPTPAQQDAVRVAVEQRNKARVLDAYAVLFGEGRTDAVGRYFSPAFIQHDPAVAAGQQGIVDQIQAQQSASPKLVTSIKHVIADGSYVLVHSHLSATPSNEFSGTAQFDLYLLAGGMIVEHWASRQTVPNYTANGHSMFDNAYVYQTPPPKPAQAAEEGNKQLVWKAVQSLFVGGNVDVLDQYWAGEAYLQHTPEFPNGTAALKSIFSQDNGPGAYQTRIAVAEGDLVYLFTQAIRPTGAPTVNLNSDFTGAAIGDLFRVVNGIIVEHWDAQLPVPASSVNGNSPFSEVFVRP